MDKFGLYTLHARKISNVGVYNMVHVFPHIRSFTCWEPQFDIADMNYFSHLSQVRKIYSFKKSFARFEIQNWDANFYSFSPIAHLVEDSIHRSYCQPNSTLYWDAWLSGIKFQSFQLWQWSGISASQRTKAFGENLPGVCYAGKN